jgi:hypothetical protein
MHRQLREAASQAVTGHGRTPEAAAHLMLGWELFLSFAEESGAIDPDTREQLRSQAWDTLCAVAREQQGYHVSEDPVDRFLRLLSAVLESGAAHVADSQSEGEPSDLSRWGWRRDGREGYDSRALGARIGWVNESELMLQPEAAFSAVQELAHRQGGSLPVTQHTLWKRLLERGHLNVGDTDHLKAKRAIGGKRKRVVALKLEALSIESGATGATGAEPQ